MTLSLHAKRLTRLMRREADTLEIPAVIVEVEQDSGTSIRVLDDVNKYFVQLYGGDENEVYEAYNVSGVKPREGMRVILRRTEGEYEILRQAPKSATELYGEFAPALSGTDQIGELSNVTWPGRNLQPGRVAIVSTAEPLKIRIEPHWYEWHGQVKLWPGGTLDMSAYLPPTADQWWWAWACIDPTDDTALAVTGEEVAGIALLTDAKLAEIGATLSGLHTVEALRLQEGMTALNRPEYFYDARIWLGNSQLPTVPIEVTTPYEVIPAGRKLHWPAPLEVTTGTLTIDGEIIIS